MSAAEDRSNLSRRQFVGRSVAGAVAALAARRGCAPHEIAWADAKQAIEKIRSA